MEKTFFTPVVSLENLPVTTNEAEALRSFLKAVKKSVEDDALSLQLLETTCWIEKNGEYWKSFYDARDHAYTVGVMKDGNILE